MLNLQIKVHTNEEIQAYIEGSLDTGHLHYDMTYVQSMLKYVHSPLYKEENPRHTKLDTDILISKFSRIFRGMLLVKEKILKNKMHYHFKPITQTQILHSTSRYMHNVSIS